jgi:DNA segregation ATPase FtsK/SpoIIIE, S-DNA-T family
MPAKPETRSTPSKAAVVDGSRAAPARGKATPPAAGVAAATSSRNGGARKPAPKKATPVRRGGGGGPHLSMNIPQNLQREMIALLVCLFAVLTAISLAPGGASGILSGWGGLLGLIFGAAAWLVPVAIGAAGVMLFVAGMLQIERLRWEMPLGIGLILLTLVGLFHMPLDDKQAAAEAGLGGGLVGYYVSNLVETLAGRLGGTIILLVLAIIGAMMAFHLSIGELLKGLARAGRWLFALVGGPAETEDAPPILMAAGAAPAGARRKPALVAEEDGIPADVPRINAKASPSAPTTPLPGVPFEEPPRILGAPPPPAAGAPGQPADADKPPAPAKPVLAGAERSPAMVAKQLSLPTAGPSGMFWKLPEVSMLDKAAEVEVNDTDLMQKARRIEETLATFGVEAKVREINSGPAVTQFALEPGEGVRVAKIAGLANDLALALAAPSIRIEAPVPGMARVGVEVPNVTPALVGLRNILETETFKHSRGKLKLPLGRDTHGQPVVTDLAKLPHLLIAGATGSGKSVAINSLVISYLMQYTPDELRMLMIDPKRVELSSFNGIPHLLRPVVTEMRHDKEANPKKGPRELTAIEVLKWLLWEMERRYKIFARGAKDADGISRIFRNIEQYHTTQRATPGMEPMPYIVLIIDELADLMLIAPEDVETALCRLAQLARATGIHLIIATQRPSVDVVTGLIKANFPARIAFAVTSMIDSRVILDSPGAEKLLGRGDALYTASDESKPIRVQGTFVSDKEAERIVQFWRKQLPEAPPAPAGAPPANGAHADGGAPGGLALAGQQVQVGANVPMPDWLHDAEAGGDGEDEDALMQQAIDLIKKHRYASTSMLQRRLRIGYNRAARLVEQMEEMGIVGPADGSRSREVLLPKDEDAAGGEDPEPKGR